MYVATVTAQEEAIIDNFQNDFRWIERPTSTEIRLRLADDDARAFLFEYIAENTYLTGNNADVTDLGTVEVEEEDTTRVEARIQPDDVGTLEICSMLDRGEREYWLRVVSGDETTKIDLTDEQRHLLHRLS